MEQRDPRPELQKAAYPQSKAAEELRGEQLEAPSNVLLPSEMSTGHFAQVESELWRQTRDISARWHLSSGEESYLFEYTALLTWL